MTRAALLGAACAALLLAGCDLFTDSEPDRTAPAVAISAPAAGSTTRAPAVEVSGTARDTTGVERVTWALSSADPAAERPVTVTPGREASFTIPVSGLAAGSNVVTVFAYDARGNRGSASVAVVFQPNRAPAAADDTASTRADSAVTVAVLRNDADADGDALRVESVTAPSVGSVRLNADGTVTYVPNPARGGPVSFRYVVADGRGGADTAAVTVTVAAPPGPYLFTRITLPPLTGAAIFAESEVVTLGKMNNRGRVVVHRTYRERTGGLPGDERRVFEAFLWENGQTTLVFSSANVPVGTIFDINNLTELLVHRCTLTFGNQRSCIRTNHAIQQHPFGTVDTLSYQGTQGFGALNDVRQVVFDSTFCQAGTCSRLPLAGGTPWTAKALNNRGEVAGVTTGSSGQLPVLYRGGQAATLQVGGPATATGINDSTWVVGLGTGASGGVFLWRGGTTTPLPAAAGTPTNAVVNNRGEVVYASSDGAYLWFAGRVFDLNSRLFGQALTSVRWINDVGQILGMLRNPFTGEIYPVVLTPVGFDLRKTP